LEDKDDEDSGNNNNIDGEREEGRIAQQNDDLFRCTNQKMLEINK
jgi:hypothetical protein